MKIEITFRSISHSASDDWHSEGPAITDHDLLNIIKNALETRILLVEHWHYYGSRAPDRLVIEDYDTFIDYLKNRAIAGDAIHVFDISDAIKDGMEIAQGKCPDEHGLVPRKGAY